MPVFTSAELARRVVRSLPGLVSVRKVARRRCTLLGRSLAPHGHDAEEKSAPPFTGCRRRVRELPSSRLGD